MRARASIAVALAVLAAVAVASSAPASTRGLLALTAVGASASPLEKRGLEYTVSLDAVQTTSWNAHGSYAWCSSSSQRLPFEGSGKATLRLSLPADAQGAAAPGAPLYLAGTLGGTVVRTGAYVEHGSAVTDRPPGCAPLDAGDSTAATKGCGRKAATLAFTVESGTLRSKADRAGPFDCPWPTDIHGDVSPSTVPAILGHAEIHDGLPPVALPSLRTPGPSSFAPASATRTATQAWHVAVPGGTLAVTTTTQVRLRVALLALIQTGRSIAGIRLGETVAELRRWSRPYGGLSFGDEGDLVDSDHRWEWNTQVSTAYRDAQGNRLVEDVEVSAPAGGARSTPAHRLVVTHAPPPATARVTRVQTVSTAEVTKEGLGAGSTLADLRRALPHGRLLVFGNPIAWLVDGPGRHRTAFMVYRGVVQSVQIGCPQTDPVQRGAPVDPAALC